MTSEVKRASRPAPAAGTLRRLALAGLLAVVATGAVVSAHAQGGHGPGMHGGGPDMIFGGPPEHVGRAVDHMLDGLGATDTQRAQIKQIAIAAATDLKAQHEAGQALHQRSMQVFTAPNVDANAAEALRQQMLAQHDQVSRRVLQAMLDVSRVLTPDQRAKIGVRMQERQAIMQERMQRMQRDHQPPAGQ